MLPGESLKATHISQQLQEWMAPINEQVAMAVVLLEVVATVLQNDPVCLQ